MLKIILVQGFCPLKINITQFPGGFRLKIIARLLANASIGRFPFLFKLFITSFHVNYLKVFIKPFEKIREIDL